MNIELQPGRYVVAVSGGVDSIVLLHLLATSYLPSTISQFTVGHFDHGIRADSGDDRRFVEDVAAAYGLEFFYDEGKLGANASEALARQKRYEFLESVRQKTNSAAIITAHHQDDVLETAIINLLRGTGREGLSSLSSTEFIKRPLLEFPKSDIKNYALKNKLAWREDPTNQDETYVRNYVRHQIVANFSPEIRAAWLENLQSMRLTNQAADRIIIGLLAEHGQANQLDRLWFTKLSHDVSKEVLAAWLRQNGTSFDRRRLEQLTILCKTRAAGKKLDVNKRVKIDIELKFLELSGTR